MVHRFLEQPFEQGIKRIHAFLSMDAQAVHAREMWHWSTRCRELLTCCLVVGFSMCGLRPNSFSTNRNALCKATSRHENRDPCTMVKMNCSSV